MLGLWEAVKTDTSGMNLATDTFVNFERVKDASGIMLLKFAELSPDLNGMEFDGFTNTGAREIPFEHHYQNNTIYTQYLTEGDVLSLEGMGAAGAYADLLDDPDTEEEGDGWLQQGATRITIKNFEDILGTDGDDIFYGTDDTNYLFGFVGNDTLFGRGGVDVLVADDGDDVLYGGTWIDDSPGEPDPLNFEDDGAADHLYGGFGNDKYYVSNNDTVWDMNIEPPSAGTELTSFGDGEVWFNEFKITLGEYIPDGATRFPLPDDWVIFGVPGALIDVFVDFDQGMIYRVWNSYTYIEGRKYDHYLLSIEDWNAKQVIGIAAVPYDPDTHSFTAPVVAAAAVATSTTLAIAEDLGPPAPAVEVPLGGDGESPFRSLAGTDPTVAVRDGAHALWNMVIAAESIESPAGTSGGSAGTRGQSTARSAAAGPEQETSQQSTAVTSTATAAATSGGESFLGITLVAPSPIDGTTGDDNESLTNGDDIYDAGPGPEGFPRFLRDTVSELLEMLEDHPVSLEDRLARAAARDGCRRGRSEVDSKRRGRAR